MAVKSLLILFVFIPFFCAFAQDSVAGADTVLSEDRKVLEVILGIDYIEKLNFVPHPEISIGNSNILTINVARTKKELVLKGQKTGETSVDVRDEKGDISARYLVKITTNDKSQLIQELKDFLGDVEGIEIGVKGDKVFVGGELVVPGDIGKVALIMANKRYEDVINLIELSPQTQAAIARKMQEEIQNNGMKDVTVRVVNRLFWLEGIVDSRDKYERAIKIALAYLPDNIETLARRSDRIEKADNKSLIQNFISINEQSAPTPLPKLLKMTAQFVELTKDYNRIFGFKWVPLMSGDGGSISFGKSSSDGIKTNSSNTLMATISNLFPKLASAKSAGHARVIQSGTLIMQENQDSGKIKKSEDKPFVIGTGEFQKSDVSSAKFDLTINKPKILEEENINFGIGLTVSALRGTPPETMSNEISTLLTIKSKQTAAVGGIVVNKNATDFDKNPPFGHDTYEGGDPLFSFMRSKSYLSNKSQFVVFVTPEIIESAVSGTEEIKKKFRQRKR